MTTQAATEYNHQPDGSRTLQIVERMPNGRAGVVLNIPSKSKADSLRIAKLHGAIFTV
jgi:hypothetical protein